MIEKIVLDYLTVNIAVPVMMETPDTPPTSFVLIEKTGSGRQDYINSATIAIQSYAPTLYEAAQINEQVKTAMDGMIDMDDIMRVQLNSDYNFTDTATKRYRYQAVYDITY